MKPAIWIVPVCVLIGGAAWLIPQTSTLTRLAAENGDLSQRIAIHKSRPGRPADAADPGANPRRKSPSAAKRKPAMDWKLVAAHLDEMRRGGGMGDMKTMIRFQQRLQEMTADDIIAALAEIETLDLNDDSRVALEQMLLGPLAAKDPERALQTFRHRLQEDNGMWAWTLSNALKGWAEKDLPAATKWFDDLIAAGEFDSKALDGRNSARSSFEGSLIALLLTTDTDAASARLAALPENLRGDVLHHYEFSNLKEGQHASFAAMVRTLAPENERAGLLSGPIDRMVSDGGYDKVTKYLETISATPAERIVCVEKAAGQSLGYLANSKTVTRKEVDDMRGWIATQEPDKVDSISGKALSQLAGYQNTEQFRRASEIALEYQANNGGDEVLASFLENTHERQLARPLAEKISDPVRREKILNRLK